MGDTSGSGGARSTQYIVYQPIGRNDGEILDIITPRAGASEDDIIRQIQQASPRGSRVMAFSPERGRRLSVAEFQDSRLSDVGMAVTQRQSFDGSEARDVRRVIGQPRGAAQAGREASGDRRGRQSANRARRLAQARRNKTRIVNEGRAAGVSQSTINRRLRAAGLPTGARQVQISDINRNRG